ncbi:MAG: hypothetical protein JNJ75_17310 [Cyclobacteriaceae bacterium]|nr:hypothetical protein [Cyclobacteriaceae bacterium]
MRQKRVRSAVQQSRIASKKKGVSSKVTDNIIYRIIITLISGAGLVGIILLVSHTIKAHW